jgi:serine/threonine protein kinase
LDQISDLSHTHLIQRIAAITRGKQRYLMFLWADGGNLRDFWENHPTPEVTANLVKNIIEELRGMAEALQKLHAYRGQYHYRHGDIKPENILNFPDPQNLRIGTFKISDLGSAQHHNVATRLRERTGGKAFATTVYQPPESITKKLEPTSRVYDIWSMGCVTLEFLVWLLYGYKELKEFTSRIIGIRGEPCSFFVTDPEGKVAHIHPAVQVCLDSLSENPECKGDTALGDLLDIVKTKLLVIELPQHTESSLAKNVSVTNTDTNIKTHQPFGKHRATAEAFVKALDNILKGKTERKEGYWFTGRSRDNLSLQRVIPQIVTEEEKASHLFPEWKPQAGPMVDRTKAPSSLNKPASHAVGPSQGQNVSTKS